MNIDGRQYRALWVEGKAISFIDQRKLPYTFEIFTTRSVDDVAFAIKEMVVRGAPAIGAAAAYGMALGEKEPEKSAALLRSTRPTAHDLFHAVEYMTKAIDHAENAFDAASTYVESIIDGCKKIGENGDILIKDEMTILTHCNAGALATVDYGTALAPLRVAHKKQKNIFVFADETRPRLQGLLTAWELHQEGIPYALIADNAAGYFMEKNEIDLVIVGADRIAKNGDFANKIGTYEKAVCAKENGIPFYVAAPASTFDVTLKDGKQIIIEERKRQEVTQINGKDIMPDWVTVKNPAFDLTPNKYVTGYITESGIHKKIFIREKKIVYR
ncbi:MAG TPA: S-methyl-5-thioribose-1-phosphate isomerase [Thermoplasmata archaeon]|jgi:methylthioribose-1-phosphate isomerase|nr:MAG TPA: S-methyl-5-thioribose-1-phosphate isomerase [Thermoplasmata archaeon]